jgi:uncharacterized protein YjbI with pentapeptide repeats
MKIKNLNGKVLKVVKGSLKGADLSGVELSGANLCGFELINTNFSCSNLRYAIFTDSDLSGANFSDANLSGAGSYRTIFADANFSSANLYGAAFVDADLSGANLSYANLSYANFCRANLSGVCLHNVNLYKAIFQNAKYNKNTKFPSPFELFKADWRECSNELTIDLMNLNCAFHPIGPPAFDKWVENNKCPYEDSAFQRICNFQQKKHLWVYKEINIRKILYDLMKEKMIAVE